jgi:hypothetical protein
VREGRGRGGGFIAGWRSGGGGHDQWLSGRAVAATNGGAGGDVGAVVGDDVGGHTSAVGAGEGEVRAGGVVLAGGCCFSCSLGFGARVVLGPRPAS